MLNPTATHVPSRQLISKHPRGSAESDSSTHLHNTLKHSDSVASIEQDIKPKIQHSLGPSLESRKEGPERGEKNNPRRKLIEEDTVEGMLHVGGLAGRQTGKDDGVMRETMVKVETNEEEVPPATTSNSIKAPTARKVFDLPATRGQPNNTTLGGRKAIKPNSRSGGVQAKAARKEAEKKKNKKRMTIKLTVEEKVWRSSGDEAGFRDAEDTDEEDKWIAINKRKKEEEDLDDDGLLDELELDEAPDGYVLIFHTFASSINTELELSPIVGQKGPRNPRSDG
jgi:hypothetical protein